MSDPKLSEVKRLAKVVFVAVGVSILIAIGLTMVFGSNPWT